MDSIIRALVTYIFIWLIFRIVGKRTLTEASTFDLLLLLIISETVQNAMADQDHSMTGGFLLIVTLLSTDLIMSKLSFRFEAVDHLVNGTPLTIFADGKPIADRMRKERIKVHDILEVARNQHGLPDLSSVRHAVLETDGGISIVLRE